MTAEDKPGPPEPDPIADVPPQYRWFARLLQRHPKWKGPTAGAIFLWILLLVGGGISVFTITRSQEAVARVHNISACTLRSYLTGVRARQEQTAHDTTLSAPARKRALSSISGIDTLLGSQVTTPENFNCTKLLADLAKHHPRVRVK